MNKETMQRLAEVLELKPGKAEHIYAPIEYFYNDYFTLERMIRLAIKYRIDINWVTSSVYCMYRTSAYTSSLTDEVDHNESDNDAERALKEAIALAVIAIKGNELGGVTSEDV